MPPLITNELKEIKLTQLELKVQQSLQLQEIKSSLQMQQSQGASVIPACLVNKFTPISPTKYKSSDELIALYKDYKNTKDIGKLAIALAKYTYFGSSVMAQSTVTGRGGTTPLDPVKLQHLRSNIRAIFPLADDAEFNQIWDKCKISIAGCCETL